MFRAHIYLPLDSLIALKPLVFSVFIFFPKMNPPLHASAIFFLLVLFFISTNIPTSVCDSSQYTNCSSPFSCGVVNNVSYPFWGGNRADYCGQPDFQLDCQDTDPKLIVNPVTYRILNFNLSEQSLTVARDDYWKTMCPSEYRNTSFDSATFNYVDMVLNVSLLYDCIDSFKQGQFLISPSQCSSDSTNRNVYYGNASWIPSLEGVCTAVIIPILETYVAGVFSGQMNILDAIDDGFGLRWVVNSDECNNCVNSGGQCGYNQNQKQFTCFCKDGSQGTSCSGSGSGSGNSSKKSVAVGVGVAVAAAAVFGILIGCWLYFVVQRRKRNAGQLKSQDLLMPPPSNGAVTSTTNMSQSAPSYPTSKFDSVQKSFYFGVQVFSYAELEEATKNFDTSMELGDGGFGTVYYGILKDGRVVAVKRHYESNAKRVEQYMNEVEILARLRHNNLVALYGCTSRHSRELILVYEYIPNGTVADHLHGKRSKSALLPWPKRMNIAVETAEALSYLHQSDVIHRDVKTNNILLDNNFRVKVADFGLSRLYPNDVTHVSTAPQGTPGYVDPEYYQCFQLTNKSDVYSFGVVLIELVSSLQAVDVKRHHHDINLANMAINKIQNHAVHELVDPYLGFKTDYAVRQMITAVAELAFRCLQRERDMRPSMNEVLEVLKEIQNKKYVPEAEVLGKGEEIMLMKEVTTPVSPDSVSDKWVSSSTASNPYSF